MSETAFDRQMARKLLRDNTPATAAKPRTGLRAPMEGWVVTCSSNDKVVTHMWSPLKPEYCPVCGSAATSKRAEVAP